MKITSLVATGVLEFNDFGTYIKGVSPILRSIRLDPGASLYLVETSEVLLSAQAGDIYRFEKAGKISVNDEVVLGAGANVVLTHNFNFQPQVSVIKVTAGPVYTDVTASADLTITHTKTTVGLTTMYTAVKIVSAAGGTFDIRLN
jgi:hypothetical protein